MDKHETDNNGSGLAVDGASTGYRLPLLPRERVIYNGIIGKVYGYTEEQMVEYAKATVDCYIDGVRDSGMWRRDYSELSMGHIKSPDLFVWAGVNTDTGEVEMEVECFDDELSELSAGWKWQRFRLIPDNIE